MFTRSVLISVFFFSFFTSLSLADNRPSKPAECYLVVDVSGSMYRYADVVKPVLRKQVDSMQDGDKVSIVRFGTYTKIREEECGQISPVFRAELNLIIEKIYERNGTLLSNTDLGEMLTALLRYMELSSAINKKIVLISDFVNDVPVKGISPISSDYIPEWHRQLSRLTGLGAVEVEAYVLKSNGEQDNSISVFQRLFESHDIVFSSHQVIDSQYR